MKKLLFLTLISIATFAQKQPQFDTQVVSNEYLGWWGRTIADINKDGLQDVIVLKQSRGYGLVTPGWLGWYEAEKGGKSWKKYVIEDNDLLGSGDLDVADLDNDGDIDVLSFEGDETSKDTTARTYWFENPGLAKMKTEKWKKHFIGNNPEFVKDVEIADFDGNGLKDVATVTYWHHALEIDYQVSKNKWEKVAFKITNIHEGMHIGDIDGDKDTDIALNGYWVQNPGKGKRIGWEIHNINDKWHNQEYKGKLEWRHNGTKVFCRDIDKDGKAEVFISHSEANIDGFPIAYYKRNPKTNTWIENVIAPNYWHCHTLQVFDMNNDGYFDVVTGEIPEHPTQKRVRIFLNKGNNKTFEEMKLSEEGIYNGIVSDFEGDGDFDIFTAPGYSDKWKDFTVRLNKSKK
jgi:hypothetical protein